MPPPSSGDRLELMQGSGARILQTDVPAMRARYRYALTYAMESDWAGSGRRLAGDESERCTQTRHLMPVQSSPVTLSQFAVMTPGSGAGANKEECSVIWLQPEPTDPLPPLRW